ncbi:hypothetical protein F511_11994 [Dorcoceras hygrometricum]|uniref:Uncharacterized protein n=1 Tax=Dorcoceras hygrometricum TaxID=472368 RepID=A0A2Z7BTQ9_9LAMI|nr:hypothetical protein F511_11994 [Dorcoceras hygrometricum]
MSMKIEDGDEEKIQEHRNSEGRPSWYNSSGEYQLRSVIKCRLSSAQKHSGPVKAESEHMKNICDQMIQRRRGIITVQDVPSVEDHMLLDTFDHLDAVRKEDHKQVHTIKKETSWEGIQLGVHSVKISLEYSRAAQNEEQISQEQL